MSHNNPASLGRRQAWAEENSRDCLPMQVQGDNANEPMEQDDDVSQDSVPLTPSVGKSIVAFRSLGEDNHKVEVEAGRSNAPMMGTDKQMKTPDFSYPSNESPTKAPVQAEADDHTDRGSLPSKCNAKAIIQDDKISSSSKTEELEFDEHGIPVNIDTLVYKSIPVPESDYPSWYKDGQYDGLLVYHCDDESQAMAFVRCLQELKHPDGTPIRICHLKQNICDNEPDTLRLENMCKKSTFFMMFLTKSFCCDDDWSAFCQHRLVIESITDPKKRWCAIPVHTEYWRNPKTYKVPFTVNGIRGICLEDSHWEDGAARMFADKFRLRKERERDMAMKLRSWKLEYQLKKYKKWKKDKKTLIEEDKQIEEKRKRWEEKQKRSPETSPSPQLPQQPQPMMFPWFGPDMFQKMQSSPEEFMKYQQQMFKMMQMASLRPSFLPGAPEQAQVQGACAMTSAPCQLQSPAQTVYNIHTDVCYVGDKGKVEYSAPGDDEAEDSEDEDVDDDNDDGADSTVK